MKHNPPDPIIPPIVADTPLKQPLGDYVVPSSPRRNSIARKILFVLIGLSALLNFFILFLFIFYVDCQAGSTINIFTTILVLPLCIPIIVWRRRNTISNTILAILVGLYIGSYFIVTFVSDLIGRYNSLIAYPPLFGRCKRVTHAVQTG